MTLSRYFYTSIFLSIIIGCFSPEKSTYLLLSIPLFLLAVFLLKRKAIILTTALCMCSCFASFYTQTEIIRIKNKLKDNPEIIVGNFEESKGKTLFHTSIAKTKNGWVKLDSEITLHKPPKNYYLDSTYILSGNSYPIQIDLFNTPQMVYSHHSQNHLFRFHIQKIEVLKESQDNTQRLESYLESEIENNFNHNSNAYLKGILLGNKSELENYIAIQTIGLAHLFAASGYHVGLLFGIIVLLFKILPPFKRKKTIEFIVTLSIIWLYATLLHFSPSILRACFLFTFLGLLRNMNRRFSMIETLSLIGVIMLIYQPLLVYQISFQLSFLAVYGILILFPLFRKTYCNMKNVFRLPLDLLTISFSAQLFTLPLTVYYFNQIPTYSLLSNLTIAPIVSLTIPIAILSLVFNALNIPNQYISTTVDYLFKLVDFLISKIQSFPHQSIQNLFLNPIDIVLILIFILIVSSLFAKPKVKPLFKITSLITLTLIINISFFVSDIKIGTQEISYLVPQNARTNIYFVKKKSLYAFESKENEYLKSRIIQKHKLQTVIQKKLKDSDVELKINNILFQSNIKENKIWKNDKCIYKSYKRRPKPLLIDWKNNTLIANYLQTEKKIYYSDN